MTHHELSPDVIERAKAIKLLLMDCDGVLTDGRLFFSERGEELKVFNVRDGQGLVSWHRAGFKSGVISGRDAGRIIQARADELGIHYVRVKSPDKVRDMEEILSDAGVKADETAFVGDDIGDIGILKLVGLPIAVRDAVTPVKQAAALVTKKKGGRGAIREITDLLLGLKGLS